MNVDRVGKPVGSHTTQKEAFPMPTQTRSRPSSQPQRRFNRSGTAARRRPTVPRRRAQKPSGLKGLVGGLLPAAAGKKTTPKGSNKGKLGGLGAVLAAGAGLAYKNREKIPGLRGRNQGAPAATGATTVPPVTTNTHAPGS